MRDSLDLRSIRDGARREIEWDPAHASALTPEQRRRVSLSWVARQKQEHLAVGAFSLLAYELADVGCEPVVLALITRAAADEVRHADVCKRLAHAILGEEPKSPDEIPERLRGVPKIPPHEGLAARDRALLHVVEMCCLNETFTGVFLTEMLERTTNPTARAAIESLLEDEIDHGRVGWAHLASACEAGFGRAVVSRALPSLLGRAYRPVVAAGTRESRDRALEVHGWLSAEDGAAIFRATLDDVILPGFADLGVDVTAARASSA